jgi:hypothetical protein
MFFGVVVPKSSRPRFHQSSIASGSRDAKSGRNGERVRIAHPSLSILPRPDGNDAHLVAWGPKRVEKIMLCRHLVLRRLANRFGPTYVGVPLGAKLEKIGEKSHRIFRLFPADRSNRSADRLRKFGDIFRGLDGAGIDHKAWSLWCGGVLVFSRFSDCYPVLVNRGVEVSRFERIKIESFRCLPIPVMGDDGKPENLARRFAALIPPTQGDI